MLVSPPEIILPGDVNGCILREGAETRERWTSGAFRQNGNRMDKTIRKYTSLDEMKADEYRYLAEPPGT
jgi:hypothetical protein